MNWEAIGAVGEMVAAFATVVTLAYLAVQIRQSARATRQAAGHAVTESGNALRLELVREPGIAALYLNGLADHQSLSREDRLRFNLLMGCMFGNIAEIYAQYERDDLSREQWEYAEATSTWLLSHPGGKWAWDSYWRTMGGEKFSEAVESALGSRPATYGAGLMPLR
jgi:hypothetical protein